MKYYLHDANAFSDEKITMLFMRFGYEGLGLFYTALEKLALQEKPINTEVLKSQLKIGKKLEKTFNYCETLGLLSSNNGETFSAELLNFAGKYSIKNEKNREKVSQWREKQKDIKNVTGYVPNCNPDKVKKSKVNKESKEKSSNFIKPTLAEIIDYCDEKKYAINPQAFIDYFESVGWLIGHSKKPMKSWKGAVGNWVQRNYQNSNDTIYFDENTSKVVVDAIETMSANEWQSHMNVFKVNIESKMLYCESKKKYVTWQMLENSQRLFDRAKREYESKGLGSTYLTPATYGKR